MLNNKVGAFGNLARVFCALSVAMTALISACGDVRQTSAGLHSSGLRVRNSFGMSIRNDTARSISIFRCSHAGACFPKRPTLVRSGQSHLFQYSARASNLEIRQEGHSFRCVLVPPSAANGLLTARVSQFESKKIIDPC